MRVYYDRDADVNLVKSKKVAVVGYGSQGHAHAMNLRDSGVAEVKIALRPGSESAAKAEGAGFEVLDSSAAAAWADVVMVLTPDEHQRDLYAEHLEPNMREGTALAFAHGLNVHFNLIEARADLDVFMIAPKGPGHTVRSEYERGAGVACWRSTRMPPATATISRCPMPAPSAAAGPVFWRPRSARNARPICSASRRCFAAACPR